MYVPEMSFVHSILEDELIEKKFQRDLDLLIFLNNPSTTEICKLINKGSSNSGDKSLMA